MGPLPKAVGPSTPLPQAQATAEEQHLGRQLLEIAVAEAELLCVVLSW